jgi:hypothetical protein
MFFQIVGWCGVPSGMALLYMLMSGRPPLQKFASHLLHYSFTLQYGKFRLALTLADWVTMVVSLLTLMNFYYVAFEVEKSADQIVLGVSAAAYAETAKNLEDYQNMSNFMICLMASVIWLTCSHMDKQIRKGTIVTVPQGLKSWMPSGKWILIFLIACLLADIPLARLDYKMQLESRITAPKTQLQKRFQDKPCNMATLNDGKFPECEAFCNATYKLSLERVNVVLLTRSRHFLGAYAADIFDRFRGVEQEKAKTDELFTQRTCTGVLASVDKSNELVNYVCYITSLLFLGVCIITLHKIIEVPSMDEETLEIAALRNFARYHGLQEDSSTKQTMMSSPVSLHIWAALGLAGDVKGARAPAEEITPGVVMQESPKSQKSSMNKTLPSAEKAGSSSAPTPKQETMQPAVTTLSPGQAEELIRQRTPTGGFEQD